jgi:hypothetical protein
LLPQVIKVFVMPPAWPRGAHRQQAASIRPSHVYFPAELPNAPCGYFVEATKT